MNRKKVESELSTLLEICPEMSFSDVCLSEIRSGNFVLKSMAERLEVDKIRNIYFVRLKIVERNKLPIRGIETLLDNLSRFNGSYVAIYLIQVGDVVYLIFTNEKVDTLLGIVAIDRSLNWGHFESSE